MTTKTFKSLPIDAVGTQILARHLPNLDAMDDSELRTFAVQHLGGNCHRLLFPAGGRGTVKATRDLARYALNTIESRAARLKGRIDTAMYYEGIAQRIYESLPVWARW